MTSDDLFAFTTEFLGGTADFNNDGRTDSGDFFDFFNCFVDPPVDCD